MIKRLQQNRHDVLGFKIEGKLDHDSFVKATHDLSELLLKNDHFRIILVVSEPEGIDFRVVWDSIRFATAHLRQYLQHVDRIAVVSDSKWIHRITKFENMILSGISEKAFTLAEKEKAINWIGKSNISKAA